MGDRRAALFITRPYFHDDELDGVVYLQGHGGRVGLNVTAPVRPPMEAEAMG